MHKARHQENAEGGQAAPRPKSGRGQVGGQRVGRGWRRSLGPMQCKWPNEAWGSVPVHHGTSKPSGIAIFQGLALCGSLHLSLDRTMSPSMGVACPQPPLWNGKILCHVSSYPPPLQSPAFSQAGSPRGGSHEVTVPPPGGGGGGLHHKSVPYYHSVNQLRRLWPLVKIFFGAFGA